MHRAAETARGCVSLNMRARPRAFNRNAALQMTTALLQPDPQGLSRAAEILRDGQLVAFPTETVYGLGADATNGAACAAVFAAKGRPRFNPLISHVPDLEAVHAFAVMTPEAKVLAQAFWPGPLTLVLPLRAGHGLSPLVSAGLDTVAIRVPAHPLARELLRLVGRPVAAPSANPSGRISPTTSAHVRAGLGGRIAAIMDGGTCRVGLESTIISGRAPLRLLRAGGLSREDIEAVLGHPLSEDSTPGKIEAPGQLSSHYAPRVAVRLNVTKPSQDAVLIGFGPVSGDLNLSQTGDLVEAAANLFGHLHRAEHLALQNGKPTIALAPVPNIDLGQAINDRLQRAAAPRS